MARIDVEILIGRYEVQKTKLEREMRYASREEVPKIKRKINGLEEMIENLKNQLGGYYA